MVFIFSSDFFLNVNKFAGLKSGLGCFTGSEISLDVLFLDFLGFGLGFNDLIFNNNVISLNFLGLGLLSLGLLSLGLLSLGFGFNYLRINNGVISLNFLGHDFGFTELDIIEKVISMDLLGLGFFSSILVVSFFLCASTVKELVDKLLGGGTNLSLSNVFIQHLGLLAVVDGVSVITVGSVLQGAANVHLLVGASMGAGVFVNVLVVVTLRDLLHVKLVLLLALGDEVRPRAPGHLTDKLSVFVVLARAHGSKFNVGLQHKHLALALLKVVSGDKLKDILADVFKMLELFLVKLIDHLSWD